MHRLAALQHRLDAGLARVASYAAAVCPMTSTGAGTLSPIFWTNQDPKRRPRPLILSQ